MTAAKTPSQRGAANRRRGHQAERDLAKWLRANGFPHAERAVRTGWATKDRASADPGDITGTPGIVWSVKDVAAENITGWMTELDAMVTGAKADLGLLVHKRRGHADPGRWWCWGEFGDLFILCVAMPYGGMPCVGELDAAYHFPTRMELRHVAVLLRAAGYGSPSEPEGTGIGPESHGDGLNPPSAHDDCTPGTGDGK